MAIFNPTEYKGKAVSGEAGGVVTAYTFCDEAFKAAGSGDAILGIVQYAANTGDDVTAIIDGVLKVYVGAAVSAGAYVQSDASGKAITRIGTTHPIGTAQTAATTADQIILIKMPA